MTPSPQSSLLVYGVLFELILMILPAHILELIEIMIISTISKVEIISTISKITSPVDMISK